MRGRESGRGSRAGCDAGAQAGGPRGGTRAWFYQRAPLSGFVTSAPGAKGRCEDTNTKPLAIQTNRRWLDARPAGAVLRAQGHRGQLLSFPLTRRDAAKPHGPPGSGAGCYPPQAVLTRPVTALILYIKLN